MKKKRTLPYIEKPESRNAGKWKMKLASMYSGDSFAAPIIKANAIRRAAWTMKKKIEIHAMVIVWIV